MVYDCIYDWVGTLGFLWSVNMWCMSYTTGWIYSMCLYSIWIITTIKVTNTSLGRRFLILYPGAPGYRRPSVTALWHSRAYVFLDESWWFKGTSDQTTYLAYFRYNTNPNTTKIFCFRAKLIWASKKLPICDAMYLNIPTFSLWFTYSSCCPSIILSFLRSSK